MYQFGVKPEISSLKLHEILKLFRFRYQIINNWNRYIDVQKDINWEWEMYRQEVAMTIPSNVKSAPDKFQKRNVAPQISWLFV